MFPFPGARPQAAGVHGAFGCCSLTQGLTLDGPVWSPELDSTILVGHFQLGVFCDPMTSGSSRPLKQVPLSPTVFVLVPEERDEGWRCPQPDGENSSTAPPCASAMAAGPGRRHFLGRARPPRAHLTHLGRREAAAARLSAEPGGGRGAAWRGRAAPRGPWGC